MFLRALALPGAILAKALNLRTALFLLFLVFFSGLPLFAPLVNWQQQIDAALFRTALLQSSPPKPNQRITLVHVPDVEFDRWLHDLAGASGLQELLQLPGAGGKVAVGRVIGLISEQPLSFIKPAAENRLEELLGLLPADASDTLTQQLLERRQSLLSALTAGHVLVGVRQRHALELLPVTAAWSTAWPRLEALRQWLLRGREPAQSTALPAGPVTAQFPVVVGESLTVPLLFMNEGKLLPSFVLSFLHAALAKQTPADAPVEPGPLIWFKDSGIEIGEQNVRMSVAGDVVPLYGEASGLKASVRQMTLHAALEAGELDGWVLLGRDGSDLLGSTAQSLAALADGAFLVEPHWWLPAQKVLILLLALFLLLAAPLLRLTALLQTGVIVVLLLMGGAFLAQITAALWLPVSNLVLFWALGLMLMLAWREKRRARLALASRADKISFDHATLLVQSYRYPEAFVTLQACRTSRRLLQHLYRLATLQKEQGFSREALATLQEIRRRRRGYKDVEQLIAEVGERLEQASRDSEAGLSTSQGDWLHSSDRALESTQFVAAGPVNRRTLGRYELLEELGRGSSGTVYLAHDPKIAREVALKTLNYHAISATNLNEIKARFFREAIAAGRLHHPNIVQVFDVGEDEQLAYIAMDYARGKPLSHFVQAQRLLPVEAVYRVAIEVAEALAYAHDQHVIHRDIKPSNIVFNPEPFQIRVMDFGIARITDYAQTSDSKILGSPLYMAPEQLLGHESGPAADIFSLGVMLYQLLSGCLPFTGDNLASLSYEIVHANHKSVHRHRSDLPPSAGLITDRALLKRPEARFTSARQMADALRVAMEQELETKVEQHSVIA